MTATLGRGPARAPVENPEALNAPLFRQIANRLHTSERQVVLDLGAASTPMLNLLGRGRCHVEIADLARDGAIERLNAIEPGADLVAAASALLPPHCADGAVDVVFCWDLPNYFEPHAMSALIQAIAARARTGALVHALIVYSEQSMPDRPGRYLPTDDCMLVNRVTSSAAIPAPRHSAEALKRILFPFDLDAVRLLANGIQEFLFRLKS